jgi:Zn-dependent protease
MRRATKLFKVFGIDIQIHYSWWFVFILLTWSLSTAFFPHYFPEYKILEYWFMGVIASLLLFVSVLLHELSHSLVARARKIKVESITLFFFGGVAGITKEDMKPSSEFMMAIAGPLFSFVLAGIFFLIFKLNGNGIVTAITFYLYQLNLILAIFNLVPGFPLDGGRAFRAILYAYYKDLRKATKIASMGGKFFAAMLIILGFYSLFSGVGGGLWFILLGGFLYFIAGVSYEQVVLREILASVKINEILVKDYEMLDPEMKFKDFVKKYAKSGSPLFIVKGKDYEGVLDIRLIQKLPPKMQSVVSVKQLAFPIKDKDAVKIDDSAYKAFRKLGALKTDILPVIKGKKLVGVINQEAIMNRIAWELKFGK